MNTLSLCVLGKAKSEVNMGNVCVQIRSMSERNSSVWNVWEWEKEDKEAWSRWRKRLAIWSLLFSVPLTPPCTQTHTLKLQTDQQACTCRFTLHARQEGASVFFKNHEPPEHQYLRGKNFTSRTHFLFVQSIVNTDYTLFQLVHITVHDSPSQRRLGQKFVTLSCCVKL